MLEWFNDKRGTVYVKGCQEITIASSGRTVDICDDGLTISDLEQIIAKMREVQQG